MMEQGKPDAVVDLDALQPDDLKRVDCIQSPGLSRTMFNAWGQLLDLSRNARVLDVGCGIGGPARTLVDLFGCRVTGVDASPEYVHAAQAMSQRMAKAAIRERTQFVVGDALALPFEDGAFDVVWTQHVSMCIEDKMALFNEFARVTNEDGQVFVCDVGLPSSKSDGSDVAYPVFWAESPETSFLMSSDEYRQVAQAAGFAQLLTDDLTDLVLMGFEPIAAAMEGKSQVEDLPPLGLHLTLPDPARLFTYSRNHHANLLNESTRVFASVFVKE
eukprot:TRINITY_DN67704_c5_g2_i1.p2 TRINITY_DN67704_c5_g2~~TRINITY_DN67704_c5_g2_i1.p2  ORF type:complete len:317 (-),score=167.08 TRINITY_DN67704_c5_g2_i1:607-1425(-)